MILLNAALIEGARVGWDKIWIWVALTLSALSTLSFVTIEHKSASPMLPLSLVSNPVFSWDLLYCPDIISYFFRDAIRAEPLFSAERGVHAFANRPRDAAVCAPCNGRHLASARLAHRISPISLMLVGSAVRLIGFAGLAFGGADVFYPLMALELILMGFGSGLGNPMTISDLISTVDKKYAGVVASGISRATGQLGSAIGVAIFGAFPADPHHIASGTRLAASISTLSTAFVTFVIWHLCGDAIAQFGSPAQADYGALLEASSTWTAMVARAAPSASCSRSPISSRAPPAADGRGLSQHPGPLGERELPPGHWVKAMRSTIHLYDALARRPRR
jgi:DHA2 family methylenomycin A resistance protein-like MFS transporter